MTEIEEFGLKINSITMEETIQRIDVAVNNRLEIIQHIVVNAAKIVHAQSDQDLRNAINNSNIVNIDGQAVVWALRFIGHEIPERVAGCDLFQELVALCCQKGYRPYFFGAKEDVLQKMVENFKEKFPDLQIAGLRNGYYSKEEEPHIMESIKDSNADMLFLGITSPKKELFIDNYSKIMGIPFIMGVGGSFDIVAGKTKRAPFWMQEAGLEWLYRVYQEPRRMWKRYLVTNIKFIVLVLKNRFRKKK